MSTLLIEQRNQELTGFAGPVFVYWFALVEKATGPWGRHAICIACCVACYQFERCMMRMESDSYRLLPDELEALQRLKERKDCPHTETAEILMELLSLENPSL